MSRQIEEALSARVAENPDLAILRAQWDFDKPLLSSALQNIGRTFPHYSRHDASHSHSILIQIERVLGKARLSRLSATDLWLLLESAYHHDAGMIVTSAELEALWTEPAFRQYLSECVQGSDEDLAAAAHLVAEIAPIGSESPPGADTRWPLRIVRSVTVLAADFRRRDHASQSRSIATDPKKISLTSPRTGLIPDRLFGILGQVCEAHGLSFDDVMRLPERETGVAGDIAHPRFVACMLRLGDLLDIDNGRFCPVMLATFGNMPQSSLAHVGKHAAIRHLRVDDSLIEVTAECTESDAENGGFEATAGWFEMLRKELRDQQGCWTLIAPMPDFGALPSEGKIVVSLRDMNSHGVIGVNAEKLNELIQGANIYPSKLAFVRELLQNAVDATLLRVWAEHRSRLQDMPPRKQYEEASKHLKELPIMVVMKSIGTTSPTGMQTWEFTVRDQGIGIAGCDLEHIRRVGDSQKNPQTSSLIREMPEYLRPSGIFGIGLQSLFQVTGRVSIRTRSYMTGEQLRVLMLGNKAGTPQKLLSGADAEAFPMPFGTSVSFRMQLEGRPKQFSWSYAEESVVQLLQDFDAVSNSDLPLDAVRVEKSIQEFAEASWVPVVKESGEPIRNPETPNEHWYPFPHLGARVRLHPAPHISGRFVGRYRGAEVEGLNLSLPYFSGEIDILQGSAKDLLTLGRDKFRKDASHKVNKVVEKAIREAVRDYWQTEGKIIVDAQARARASFCVSYLANSDPSWPESLDWRELHLGTPEEPNLGEIADCATVKVLELSQKAHDPDRSAVRIDEGNHALIETTDYSLATTLARWLLSQGFRHCSLRDVETEMVRTGRMYSKAPIQVYPSPDDQVRILIAAIAHRYIGCRRTIPLLPGFESLALKSEIENWLTRIESECAPRMLLPFTFGHDNKIRLPRLKEFLAFLQQKVAAEPDIVKLGDEVVKLIKHVHDLVGDRWKENIEYSIEAAEREIREAVSELSKTRSGQGN